MSGDTRIALIGGVVDGRYELRRLIARGGMGLVFEAHHKYTRRVVAVKILAPQVRGMFAAHGRLLREALALTTVRHPRFVEVLDAGQCGTHGPYLVMEMLDGRSLDGILAARRRLPVSDAVQVALQVCDAVAHAHAHGVLHRDLKPSNFFVARGPTGAEIVKVIDLGVAAIAAEQLEAHDAKLTLDQEVLGTPEYMAPEQLWGREVDGRADVYAIGISIFECLTGEVPYTGSYPEVLLLVAGAAGPPRVRDYRPDVPLALASLIESAIAKDPAARPQSVRAFGRALVEAGGFLPTQSALLPPASVPSRAGPRVEPAIELVNKKPVRPVAEEGTREHRRFPRAPYVTLVLVSKEGETETEARCQEISEGGMLLVAPLAFEQGVVVDLRFATPVAGDFVVLRAQVRWSAKARGRCAMGLEFKDAPPSLRALFAQYAQLFQSREAALDVLP